MWNLGTPDSGVTKQAIGAIPLIDQEDPGQLVGLGPLLFPDIGSVSDEIDSVRERAVSGCLILLP